jgi:Winged helix DNA-binding domain
VAQRLLAIQGQDPRGARLAIRARTTGLNAADVDRALTQDRSLLITWLNRGTLHLVRSEDYSWLHALTTPSLFTASARRLAQEGVSTTAAERGVAVIKRALSSEGPLTRPQLSQHLDLAGVPTKGQALIHLLMLASLRGLIVRGPMIAKQHAFVLVEDWLGPAASRSRSKKNSIVTNRDSALAELARRYLAGHGPATDRDLAKWAGLALREVRIGLMAIAPELRERSDGLLELAKSQSLTRPQLPPARLLGSFDPVLLGWRSREPILGSHQGVVTINGIFRPIAIVRGQAVGTWRLVAGKVLLEPFDKVSRRDTAKLTADAKDLERYLSA